MAEEFNAYIRVSTLKQVKGHSLDYQREAIKKYAKANDIKIRKYYVDAGISGVKFRPKLQQCIDTTISQNDISGIISYTVSRFGRSTQDILFNIEKLNEVDKRFISVKEQFDPRTRMGKMMLTMLASIAEFDRENILEQMAAGREYARKHGTKSGKPMHRPRKEIDWKKVNYYREHKISWRRISEMVGVSTPTLIKRAREKGYTIKTFDVSTVQIS